MSEVFKCVCADEITGRIISIQQGPLVAFTGFAPPIGQVVVEGEADHTRQYVDVVNLSIIDRPLPNIPDTKVLSVNEVWSISSIAEGTEVVVDGVSQGQIDETGLELEFPIPGEWTVELYSPWPYLGKTCIVTVEA